MAAHHRHVAGVIMHAVLLLVGGIVLLIDHDQTEIGVGQEQRRARADHDRDLAVGNRPPGARALARRQLRMPFRRPHAEAGGEAVEELRGERDLRHQDQALPAAADGVGHRFEINLRLARAGDAVEQGHGITALRHGRFQRGGGGALVRREFRLHKIRIGLLRHRLRRQHQSFERAFVDQAVDHAHADAGLARGVALAAHHAVGEERQHALPRRRHALRGCAGKPHADAFALGAQMLAHAQAHAQHHAARAHGVVRHPIDEAAQFGAQRRQFELLLDVLEPVVEPRIGLWIVRPHHRGGLAGTERHADDVARGELELFRHPIRIGPVEGDREEDVDDAFGHGGIFARLNMDHGRFGN